MNMTKCRHAVALIAISLTTCGYALTTPKESIESISFDVGNYRTYDAIGGTIRAEVPVYQSDDRWFFTAALGGSRIRQDRRPASYDRIGGELGLRYQVFTATSLAAAASYDWFLGTPNYKTAAAHLRLRQAFRPDDAALVPYVRVNGILQFLDPVRESPAQQDESYRLLALEAIGGLEIRIRKDLRWVFEGGRSQSKAINNAGPDLADGWIGSIAMRYDWF